MKKNNTLRTVIATQAVFILCFYIYLLFVTTFAQIDCKGCLLCGMTHAFRFAFKGDFISAYQSNQHIFVALAIFVVFGVDMCISFIYLFYSKRK